MHKSKKGKLFIVSAPSGAGKTTLITHLLNRFKILSYSISHTTRKPRGTEQHGKDYFFISAKAFKKKIDNDDLLEWAKVHDNYYGTSKRFVEQTLERGKSLLLDIDVQGAIQIMESGLDPISIFIMPPSLDELEKRLTARGTDAHEVIAKRLKNAKLEMARKDRYTYTIVNDNLNEAIVGLCRIIENEMK